METNKVKRIRIEIPEQVQGIALSAYERLSEMGADLKFDALFEEALLSLDQNYFESQIERLTPEGHILEEAKNDPEIMALLSLAAKKMLLAKKEGKPLVTKRGRKPVHPKEITN